MSRELREALAPRYELQREIARGGAAIVFLARDVRHDRDVAIKVFRRELRSAVDAERFAREIRIAAQLNHPHILPVHDSGEAAGCLFYVMPFVESGTLRDRLTRNGPLPLPDVLHVAREVGDALSFAHAHGLVHRDIKPENILLLSGDHVSVADFGLARAEAADQHLTSVELAVGTPLYMSPEQADGRAPVDPRSDEYSLACVLFELLGGHPPFEGATALAVLQKHTSAPIPSIRTRRPDVPEFISLALQRAMAKEPSDRFRSIPEFMRALGLEVQSPSPMPTGALRRALRARRTRRAVPTIALAAATVGAFALLRGAPGSPPVAAATVLDTTRYVVLPLARPGGEADSLPAEQLLFDALAQWEDLKPVDPMLVDDLVRTQGKPVDHAGALDVARRLGAGRFVRGEVRRIGDSLRLYAAVYDATRAGAPAAEATTRVPIEAAAADPAFTGLVAQLLFRTRDATRVPSTRSVAARRAYLRGRTALRRWALADAESLFATASELDPGYPEANLWRAQLRLWASDDVTEVRALAARALAAKDRLTPHDAMLAGAIHDLAVGRHAQSCSAFQKLVRADSLDFAAWYGLAECHRRDEVIVPHAVSPSRWRFRGSAHTSVQAYRRAFDLVPSSRVLVRSEAYARLKRLLLVSSTQVRRGHREGDTARFLAYPSWDSRGDSLVLWPYPAHMLSRLSPAGTRAAVTRNRAHLLAIGLSWTAAAPGDPDALEALAIGYELTGSPLAIGTLRLARARSTSAVQRRRLALAECMWRVKAGLGGDIVQFDSVRVLGTALLSDVPADADRTERLSLVSLALLLGRPSLAVAIAAPVAGQVTFDEYGIRVPLPTGIAATVERLAVQALAGFPGDSLMRNWNDVRIAIERFAPRNDALAVQRTLLRRLGSLSFPSAVLPGFARVDPAGDDLVEAQQALVRGDTTSVRRRLRALDAMIDASAGQERTPDATLYEALLYLALADTSGAERWIERGMAPLPAAPATVLSGRAERAAAVARLLVLRADLARARGDARATRWEQSVLALWLHAEPILQPTVLRMRRQGRN